MSINEELSTIKSLLEQKTKELKCANDDINNLLSGTEIATVFLDTAMRIKRFTPQCARLLDLSASDIGRSWADLTPTFRDGNLVDGAIRALEYPVSLEDEVVANDGNRYLRRTQPYRKQDNRIDGVVITFIDISGQKAIERQCADREQRLAAILDAVVDGVVGVGPNGIISEFSAAAERLFECPARKAIGQSLQRFLQLGPAQSDVSDIMRLLEGQTKTNSQARLCEGVRANGELFPAEVLGTKVDKFGMYVLLVRDTSQRRGLERQIIESSTREQQRIGELIHNGLGQQLAAVTMLASALADKLDNARRPEAAEARRLAEEVERALLDSKAIIQGLAPADVAPKRLVDALKTLADQVSCATGVRCDVHGECEIRATDRLATTHLYRIAQEALNNAVCHGKPFHIDIRLQRSEGRVRLSVRDDGKWADKREGGPDGLGLHIMAYRASILGGTITVEPQMEGGTLMLCEIPLVVDQH